MPIPWLGGILLGGLFLIGLLHWGILLDWFNNQFNVGDWHLIVGPELSFLEKAFRSGQLPLHGESPLLVPGRYFSRVGRPFSPQTLLLFFLEPNVFVLVNVWIMYAVGFIGLLILRKRYNLSIVSFVLLFLLFNFNGHITAHLAIGHIEWVGYFLLPYYVLLVLHLVEGKEVSWRWVLGMALTLLFINLQGAYHFFLWCMVFLFLIMLFRPRLWKPVLTGVIASGLVSMVRILPTAIEYYKGSGIKFMYGFFSIPQLFDSLIVPHAPYVLNFPGGMVGFWEYDFFIGLVGLAFIVSFGMIRTWLNQKSYRVLFFPMLVMLLFSLQDMYKPLFNSPLPFLDSERVPARFIIVPLVFLITLASIEFNSFVDRWKNEQWQEKILALFGTVFVGYELFQHSRIWRPEFITTQVSERFTDIIQVNVVNISDPPYIFSIIFGLAIMIVSLGLLIYLAYRRRNRKPEPASEEVLVQQNQQE